ncbi:AMP-binding protein [Rhodococcus oxybenzonivorans]|nr:AMP-binding protein [Rhodococcus oxybenzonivorans]MDV7355295.1 AMP-binding protein [Rhodococcus oxybenzonivorans]
MRGGLLRCSPARQHRGPLNARHKAAELAYIIENADLKVLLTLAGTDEYVDFVDLIHDALPSLEGSASTSRLALPEAPRLRGVVLIRGEDEADFIGRSDFDRLAVGHTCDDVDRQRLCVRVRDTAAILYTSGTTAHPRGCMLSHEAMTRGPVDRATKRLTTDGRERWTALPYRRARTIARCHWGSGTYLADTYFEPGRALELIARERPTTAWPWFPAAIQALMDHPSFDAGHFDSLRYMFLIGPRVLIEQVQGTFRAAELVAACGMTETAGIYALSERSETVAERSGAQGKPAPGIEIRISDPETEAEQPLDVPGEILVRGYCATEGYYKNLVKTAEAIDDGRWLHTGDLYSRNEAGRLAFHGRLKDMLKVGGENVAAIEIEAFLCEHPAVKAAAVIGTSR